MTYNGQTVEDHKAAEARAYSVYSWAVKAERAAVNRWVNDPFGYGSEVEVRVMREAIDAAAWQLWIARADLLIAEGDAAEIKRIADQKTSDSEWYRRHNEPVASRQALAIADHLRAWGGLHA